MPYRRKHYKKKYQRKKRKPRRKRNNGFLSVPNGMPKTGRAKLRYVEFRSIIAATGSLITVEYRANGLFDPRADTGGHQPMGFDEWAALFNHYVVVGSKCTFVFSPTTDTNMTCGVYLSSAPSSYTSWIEFNEAKRGSQRMITDAEKTTTVSVNYSAKKFFNITDIKDNFSRLGAAVSADPTEQAHFIGWIQATDLNSSVTAECSVAVDYIVDFSEPKNLTQS